ncbi:putative glycosyltransferase [Bacillus sp. TS-2]|nr:putative glycosyltransferase [Bacillus sp. TS-2]
MPKVSVIMPVFNSEIYIEEAIHSILNQSFQDFEFIIVDDCSTDQSRHKIEKIAKLHPNKIVFIPHESNRGAAAARNTAIAYSHSDILVFADSDDIQHPKRLELSYKEYLKRNVDMVFHDCQMIDPEGKDLNKSKGYPGDLSNENVLWHLLQRNHFWMSLSLVKKTKEVRFDENLINAEDYDLFLRLILKEYSFSILDETLTKYRLHPNNISKDIESAKQSIKKVLGKVNLLQLLPLLKQKHGETDAMIAIACAYMWLEEMENAIDCLKRLPFSFDGYFPLGVAYYKQKEYESSMKIFQALFENREDPAVANNIGCLTALTENYSMARKWFQKAVDLRPDFVDANYNLSRLTEGELRITERPLRDKSVHT